MLIDNLDYEGNQNSMDADIGVKVIAMRREKNPKQM